jgi:inositol transport system substrate-binding protein
VEEINPMKRLLLGAAFAAMMTTTALAEKIGVSIINFDNNFQTLLKQGMEARAKELGIDIQVEDAQNDVGKQLDQVKNFIASGVNAIVLTIVDSSAGEAITAAAEAAKVPLVFVNVEPSNVAKLPANQAYVGSNEIESGTLGAFEACKMLRAKGKANGAKAYILIGDLAHQASIQRTKDVKDVLSTDMCKFITIIHEQEGKWARNNAQDIMTNWLSSGEPFDVVFANNDEMAIGAIQGMKASGLAMDNVVVVGVDATQDALQAMTSGDLDVTVFQNAKAQGGGGIDTALALAKGEKVNTPVYIPFELVTPANMANYLTKN